MRAVIAAAQSMAAIVVAPSVMLVPADEAVGEVAAGQERPVADEQLGAGFGREEAAGAGAQGCGAGGHVHGGPGAVRRCGDVGVGGHAEVDVLRCGGR